MRYFCILLLAMTAFHVHAEFVDGAQLNGWCQSESHTLDRYRCLAYVVAVADTHSMMYKTRTIRRQFCLGEQTKIQMIGDAVSRYFKDYDQTLDVPASSLVVNALRDSYPCE